MLCREGSPVHYNVLQLWSSTPLHDGDVHGDDDDDDKVVGDGDDL